MTRKVFIILAVLLVSCSMLYADPDSYKEVSRIMAFGRLSDANAEKIKALSGQLTDSEKNSVWTRYQVSATEGFLWNLVLGFGSGSKSQGDPLHIVFAGCDVVSTGLLIAAFISESATNAHNELYHDDRESHGGELAVAGLAGLVAVRIWQCIRPYTYARSFNSKLSDALGMGSVTVGFLPLVTRPGEGGFTLSAKVSF